jgi:hypothetical protein
VYFRGLNLLRFDAIVRADRRAAAAVNALVGVYPAFAILLGNSLVGALALAGTAVDAIVTNFVCHTILLKFYFLS